MKKSLCLYFQVHQPTRLRLYRFFDIGKDSHYYDDFANRTTIKRVAQRCYLPMNALLLELLKKYDGQLKLAFSISGSTLELFDRYAPEVIESFQELAKTGNVEFLCETYSHSLASLASPVEFKHQVLKHSREIERYFGQKPTVFHNTDLIYSTAVGQLASELGFDTVLTEGAKHIMGWRSPNYLYTDEMLPDLKLMLRNYKLSDDIALRFSDRSWDQWPLTAEKYLSWLKADAENGEIVNLFMDYETFGETQNSASGIFDFMSALMEDIIADGTFEFVTPSIATEKHKPVSELDIPEAISCVDEERDVTSWLGNELQQDAFNKLYSLVEKLGILDMPNLWSDFGHLQESDHFYYMNTKFFSSGAATSQLKNPYNTPYDAFINYMNALSDFMRRVDDGFASDESDLDFAKVSGIPSRDVLPRKVTPVERPNLRGKTPSKVAKKTVVKKPAAKKTVAKKATPKKVAPKKAVVKKVATKKK